MTSARTADLIAAAVRRRSAVPAFNVVTLEHAEAIAEGAERAGVPVLLQLSRNAIDYHGALAPIAVACREIAAAAAVEVAIHLDHIDDTTLAEEGIATGTALGISSIMIDAATLPWEQNVARTRDLARRAQAEGFWVEAELGEIGGKDGAHSAGVRTNPAEAASFVAATGVDGLAVAVGSSHAMAERGAQPDTALIARIAAAAPLPLVLHGSSGVPDAAIAAAVRAGIRKVNVGTALNLAWVAAVRGDLAADPTRSDPRPALRRARDDMARVVADFCAVTARPWG